MHSIFGVNLVEQETTMNYKEFLSKVHHQLQPQYYVEVGIREGATLSLARGMSIGINPTFKINSETQSFVKLFRCTSDDFFKKNNLRTEFNDQSCQLAFIDGLHLFEYALRDFRNIETYCESESVIIFDDVRPRNLTEAQRKATGGAWTGDIWKIYHCLQKYRPDLKLSLIHTQPTGLLLVTNLDAKNTIFWNSYNMIIEEFLSPNFPEYPKDDYFDEFIMPEDFLKSDLFHKIQSFFYKKFNAQDLKSTADQFQQLRQEIEKVLKEYGVQLQNMSAALEASDKKHQHMMTAKWEEVRAYLLEHCKQSQTGERDRQIATDEDQLVLSSQMKGSDTNWETF